MSRYVCSLCGAPTATDVTFLARRREVQKNFGIYLEDLPGTPCDCRGTVCWACHRTGLTLFNFVRRDWDARVKK